MARCTFDPSAPLDGGDPLAGTPYRALRLLGRGGMGEVIEAEHRALGKRVVVKLVHRAFAGDPRFADRLRVEAQALAAIASPYVVEVLDLGTTPAGRAYFVMERLQGVTLREELARRGMLPVMEAIEITRQVLSGLAAAHRVGIVHRDVKPDNVFLCAPEAGGARVVKVLDFGVAKVTGTAAPPFRGPSYPTEAGMMVGTPRTASPEQARCQPVDARADVYAAGLLLYTLIVGHGPFAHLEDPLDLLHAHLREMPAPPSRFAAQEIPPALDRAILKALAKRPEHRFASAEQLADELAWIGASLAEGASPLPEGASPLPEGASPLPEGASPLPGRLARLQGARAAARRGRAAAFRRAERARGAGRGRDPEAEAGRVRGGEAGPVREAEIAAWFEPLPDGAGAAEASSGVAVQPEHAAPVDVRLFVALTAVSTVVFSVVAAAVLRGVGVW